MSIVATDMDTYVSNSNAKYPISTKTTFNMDLCLAWLMNILLVARVVCLDQILWAEAWLIGRIPRFGHVTDYMRDALHSPPSHSGLFTVSQPWCGAALWARPQCICKRFTAPPWMSNIMVLCVHPNRLSFCALGLLLGLPCFLRRLSCNLEWASHGASLGSWSPCHHILVSS